jgi:hypothetical protein
MIRSVLAENELKIRSNFMDLLSKTAFYIGEDL